MFQTPNEPGECTLREVSRTLNLNIRSRTSARESAIANGLCLVNPMHVTAAVYVNYDEPSASAHRRPPQGDRRVARARTLGAASHIVQSACISDNDLR